MLSIYASKNYLKRRLRNMKVLNLWLITFQFLYSISTEVPNRLRDSNWIDLCEISTAGERERYVRSIYFHEMARQKVDAANAEMSRTFQEVFYILPNTVLSTFNFLNWIECGLYDFMKFQHLEEDRLRFERGEMVYGNEFHSLYGCFRGIDCRSESCNFRVF